MEAYAIGASSGYAIGKSLTCGAYIRNKYKRHRQRFSCILMVKGCSYLCELYSDAKKYFIDIDKMCRLCENYEERVKCPTERILLFDEVNEKLLKLAKKLPKKLVIVSRDLNLLRQFHTKTPYYLCPSEGLMRVMSPMYGDNKDEFKADEVKRLKYHEAVPKARIILVDSIEELNDWVKKKYAIKHKHYELS